MTYYVSPYLNRLCLIKEHPHQKHLILAVHEDLALIIEFSKTYATFIPIWVKITDLTII
jgi:hypothetical protein